MFCFESTHVGPYNAFTESRATVSILKPPSSRLAGISRSDAFLKRFNVAYILLLLLPPSCSFSEISNIKQKRPPTRKGNEINEK